MNCLKYISNLHYGNLRMHTQLIIMLCPLLTVVILLILGAHLIHEKKTFTTIQLLSESILKKQSLNLQTITMKRYTTFCSNLLEQTWNPQYKLNALYQYSQSHQVETESPLFCPLANAENKYQTSFYTQQVCYNAYNGPSFDQFTENNLTDTFVILNSVLNTLLMEFDITQMFLNVQFYYTLITDDQITAIWPQQPAEPFKPFTRPWFINHVQKRSEYPNKEQFYSGLYKFQRFRGNYNTVYGITQSQSLLLDGKLVGIIAEDINFQIMQSIIKNYEDLNIMFLYQNGQLLFQNTYLGLNLSKENVVSIFEVERTGFNSSDWTTLQQIAITTNNVYLFNSKFGFSVLINIQKVPNSPFYLMIFNNLVHEDQQQKLMKQLLLEIQDEFLNTIEIYIIIVVCLLVIIFIAVIQILKPIKEINNLICKHKFTDLLRFKQYQSDNKLLNLKQTIVQKHSQLQRISFKKNDLCRLIDDFKFQRIIHDSNFQFYMTYIQDQAPVKEDNDLFYTCIRNLEAKI